MVLVEQRDDVSIILCLVAQKRRDDDDATRLVALRTISGRCRREAGGVRAETGNGELPELRPKIDAVSRTSSASSAAPR